MSSSAFVLLSIIAAVSASCDTWPNGTETAFHWWQCNAGPIQYHNAEPYDATGTKIEYPIQLSKPSIVRCDMDNPNNVYSSPSLRLSIKLWSWGTCDWSPVPTLGLL
ncbi:hypothetical protein ANCDUO_14264 [Ancylostoma duodenale]|uniref:Alpha-carbonic anhydrase domain-containing protein n=1 Tax=Ancylostoma duodenale TaxID=51022 RepID=A0A0C2CGS0_9BILA|nr:hypothetical protein ANCDUO_14264 [Ancylostoma duodenale]